jgi:glutamate racemase
VVLIDTGDAVARQLARLLQAAGSARNEGTARLDGYTTASATALATAFNSLLGIDLPVHEVTLPAFPAPQAQPHI